MGRELTQRVFAVDRGRHVEAFLQRDRADERQDRAVIVDDQEARARGLHSSQWAPAHPGSLPPSIGNPGAHLRHTHDVGGSGTFRRLAGGSGCTDWLAVRTNRLD